MAKSYSSLTVGSADDNDCCCCFCYWRLVDPSATVPKAGNRLGLTACFLWQKVCLDLVRWQLTAPILNNPLVAIFSNNVPSNDCAYWQVRQSSK